MKNIDNVEISNLIIDICEQNNIKCNSIKKADSGFTNNVHIVNDEYIIKIINTFTKPEKLQKEIAFYKNVKIDSMPQYVASGTINDKDYLIIKKLKGKSLYTVWHTLDEQKRKDAIIQIANILDAIHKQKGDFLAEKFIQTDWVARWQKSFDLHIKILKNKGFDVSFLEDFRNTRLIKIFRENKPCLVHNDAHFDNFLYNDGKIYIIDFDRVLYCSLDYELMIISAMVDNPKKYASEITEKSVVNDEYGAILDELKAHTPEMFNFEYIEDRVFIYKFTYYLGQGHETNDDNWITTQLKNFRNHFGYYNKTDDFVIV